MRLTAVPGKSCARWRPGGAAGPGDQEKKRTAPLTPLTKTPPISGFHPTGHTEIIDVQVSRYFVHAWEGGGRGGRAGNLGAAAGSKRGRGEIGIAHARRGGGSLSAPLAPAMLLFFLSLTRARAVPSSPHAHNTDGAGACLRLCPGHDPGCRRPTRRPGHAAPGERKSAFFFDAPAAYAHARARRRAGWGRERVGAQGSLRRPAAPPPPTAVPACSRA